MSHGRDPRRDGAGGGAHGAAAAQPIAVADGASRRAAATEQQPLDVDGGTLAAPAVSQSVFASGYLWAVLGIALMAQVAYSLPNQGISAIAPFLQADLGMTREQIGLLVSFGQIGMASTFLASGWATDRFGSRPVAIIGLAITAFAPLATALARDPLLAYAGAILAGIGIGFASPSVTMMVLGSFPARTRGTAVGIKQTGTPGSGILAAASLPALSQVVGWRVAVAGLAGVIVASLAVVLAFYRDAPRAVKPASRGGGGWITSTTFSRGVLTLTCFAAVMVSAQYCLIGYMTLFVTEWLGRNVVIAGWMLSAAQAGGIVGRVIWGLMSDRMMHGARKPVLVAAGIISAILISLMATLGPQTSLMVVTLVAFATGFAVLGWQGVHLALASELAAPAEAGRVVGFSLTMLQVGPIVGPPLVGRLLDASGSYPLAWLAIAASCALVTVAFTLIMPKGVWRQG